MKADYKNWVPKGMIYGFCAAAAGLAAVAGVTKNKSLSALFSAAALGCGAWTAWCVYANSQFSYDGKRYGFLANALFRIVDKTKMCQVIEIEFK